MFSLFRPKKPVAPAAAASCEVPSPATDPLATRRQAALEHLAQALRCGQVQLVDTQQALGSIVNDLVRGQLAPLSGRSWELLGRRLRADCAQALGSQLRALSSLQQANDNVREAIGMMGRDQSMASEQACKMAEATVRHHLSACTQRLTLIAQMVRQLQQLQPAVGAEAAA